ncbi:glucosamine 6-phosphate N-acetyltransferase [Elaeis guineensis]|uniref:Glucosamine 6-phosphate N-acetyltransferase n=1 Tax=Elaeis guineensis var. tenera TaxID=51953 RepID=A0A6I9RL45_ELAGV|nr:glucosamine 6-phosphate N-acetyltransferase [Elaeis guineensis]XP_010928469.1 glucosamine 6-phosphate N-acetyltransferase [Elaeis guineensis]XP_010928470.1 glucosamine 6-phosphate N-acetyltransferase [Elaeis guineensis]
MENRSLQPVADAEGGRGDDDLLPIRRLEISDNSKGFVELLAQLSPCPPLSDADFSARFADLAALGDDHVICVIEDPRSGRIIATGSVFIERKFLRGCAKVGHIEDVVVDTAVRCRHLGQRVVQYLVEHAKAAGCYKVILDCEPDRRAFYEKCGFTEKSIQMALYF